MTAEIVSIGTELLLGQIVDTNAAELGRFLAEHGIAHYHRQTVGDNLDRAVSTIKKALDRADIVFTIGGLGPTKDDITREAVAMAMRVPLVEDADTVAWLKDLFQRRGIQTVPSQFRQALRPETAENIANENGTAPGLWCPNAGKVIVCLPGPRNEFSTMLQSAVRPKLTALTIGGVIESMTLRVFGIGEAALAEQIDDLLQGQSVTVAPYAKIAEVHLRLTTIAPSWQEAQSALAPVAAEIRKRIGDPVYGEGEEPLEEFVSKQLERQNLTLATVESCTGGLLGATLTRVEGVSSVYDGGLVTYSAQQKTELAGVPPNIIAETGTVSAETAQSMAEGTRSRLKSDIAVSITGVAGRTPVEEAGGPKEPGMVFIGVSSKLGSRAIRHQGRGDRETIRLRAVALALHEVRQEADRLT